MSELFHVGNAQQRTRRTGPGRGAIFASVALHLGLAGAIAVSAFKPAEVLPDYKVYRVDIYSPPPQVEGIPEAASKPEPAVIKPPEPKEVVVAKKPEPKPAKAPDKKNVSAGTGKSDVAKGRNPDPKALVGGEGLDVHIAGEEFPYPGYLENIIVQLHRYFRWNGAANLEVRVGFEIMRDGSVKSIKVLQKSGNINFDLEAVAAIENAGKRGAFGPLPKGWVADRLPVAFGFVPPGR